MHFPLDENEIHGEFLLIIRIVPTKRRNHIMRNVNLVGNFLSFSLAFFVHSSRLILPEHDWKQARIRA